MFYALHEPKTKINWGVVWYNNIDFADWSIISACIEAIQKCVKF